MTKIVIMVTAFLTKILLLSVLLFIYFIYYQLGIDSIFFNNNYAKYLEIYISSGDRPLQLSPSQQLEAVLALSPPRQ